MKLGTKSIVVAAVLATTLLGASIAQAELVYKNVFPLKGVVDVPCINDEVLFDGGVALMVTATKSASGNINATIHLGPDQLRGIDQAGNVFKVVGAANAAIHVKNSAAKANFECELNLVEQGSGAVLKLHVTGSVLVQADDEIEVSLDLKNLKITCK